MSRLSCMCRRARGFRTAFRTGRESQRKVAALSPRIANTKTRFLHKSVGSGATDECDETQDCGVPQKRFAQRILEKTQYVFRMRRYNR